MKLSGSLVFAVLIAGILLCVLVHLRDSLAWLSTALGLAAGWATGVLLAPYESERDRFKEYAKVVSGFITGYAVSKLDRLFDLWFDADRGRFCWMRYLPTVCYCASPVSYLRLFPPTSRENT
jgi:hypothetical protein